MALPTGGAPRARYSGASLQTLIGSGGNDQLSGYRGADTKGHATGGTAAGLDPQSV